MRTLKMITVFVSLIGSVNARAAVHVVEPGSSIQAMIDQASPGDEIRVKFGTYRESLHIDKADIRLIGLSQAGKKPVLDGESKRNDGIIASGSGLLIENFHVLNYKGNGIMTQAANNVRIRRNLVESTGIYGIYPTLGTNIIVEDNIVTGIADAGIYIGMCKNTDVVRNIAYENVAGIEIENSLDSLVESNLVYDNTGGILVFTLPGLPKKENRRTIVRSNFVRHNNFKNFAPNGAIVANVPPGAGIIIFAADEVQIEDNQIIDNQLAGVLVTDLGVLGDKNPPDPEVEPNPDQVEVLHNYFSGNGKKSLRYYAKWYHYIIRNMMHGGAPDGSVKDLLPPGADLIATNKGKSNCMVRGDIASAIDADHFSECSSDRSSWAIRTKIDSTAVIDNPVATPVSGEQVYAAVCSGCHAASIVRIGPPVAEIQDKYRDNPDGIAKFATMPKQVRKGFPPMPPQDYLGQARLKAAADYMLSLKIAR